MTVHGGDVRETAEEMGIPASELLDFSANINPRGLPLRARERLARDASDPGLLSLYPDPSARRLRNALSEQLGVTAEAIVVGPGAEALLAPVLRCLQPQRMLVPVPAFGEYRRVCEQQHIEFVPFPLERPELFRIPVNCFCRRIEAEPYSAVLLNNPHNPSGAMLDAHEVRRVLDAASSSGAILVIDEAFIDYAPHASLVREAAARRGLIVIRSLTKFYGCPALRVGYAVAHPETIRRIRSLLPAWPVTQLAIDALAEAIADREYAEASLRENAAERERLSQSLSGLGLTVFPSAANYLLVELREDMPAASEDLAGTTEPRRGDRGAVLSGEFLASFEGRAGPVPPFEELAQDGARRALCATELRARLIRKHRILIRNCDSYEGLAPGRTIRVAVRASGENCRLIQALSDELRWP